MVFTLVMGLLSGGVVHAQAAAARATENPGWETSAAAALTLTRGNSDTLLTTLSLDTKRKWEMDEAFAGIAGGYGKNEDTKNAEFIKGYAQYNRLFNERLYGGLRLDGNYDGIANLDYRFTLSPLLGYYLIKEAKTSLSVEAGPALVLEKYKSQSSDTYLAARFGERFEHKLTDTTRIWQSLEYVPRVDRWAEKYIITAEIGIDTAITKQWSLRIVAQDIRDSEPAGTTKKNDFRLIAGTAYKF
jgi:putative salt-induced outer membrane protein YdiY